MCTLTDKLGQMLDSHAARELFRDIDATVNKHGMAALLDSGVAVGFSGGADSTLLLCYLYQRRRREALDAPLLAIHINHLIRGDSASRDAAISAEICNALGIEYVVCEIDVPAIATECGIGIEEAARNTRYSYFDKIKQGREDIACVALAHNSTDNVETMVMNMLRGSGPRGMCGIPSVRDFYVRPLIEIPKARITSLLDRHGIPYAHDESNDSDDYTRNYVRHNILPHFERIAPSFEATVTRTADNMRSAYGFIRSHSDVVVDQCLASEFSAEALRGLHYAVFSDAFARVVYYHCGTHAEESHIRTAYSLVEKSAFALSLPGDHDLVCQRGICFFENKSKKDVPFVNYDLKFGENKIHGTNVTVYIGEGSFKDISTNIYKFSISVALRGDIIDKGVSLRFKRDGDAYRYGGHTRRLKKVFNDRGIPPFMRSLIPVITDGEGIVWVVGLSPADRARPADNDRAVSITVCFGEQGRRLYTALPPKSEENT